MAARLRLLGIYLSMDSMDHCVDTGWHWALAQRICHKILAYQNSQTPFRVMFSRTRSKESCRAEES